MPINFLQNIKSSFLLETISTEGQNPFCKQIAIDHRIKAYVFSCKDLPPQQPLFNDGTPSLILLPNKLDTARLNVHGKKISIGTAWLCCGVIKNTYWEIASALEYILVLRFAPAYFYSFFNVSPSVFLANPIRRLEDVLHDKWLHMFDQMYEKKTLSDKISFLRDRLSLPGTEDNLSPMLSIATEYIQAQRGNTNVVDVLQHLGVGVNAKWLHRNFVKYLGIAPKKYISLQRFIFTYQAYKSSKSKDLSDVALSAGYYDYNHFLKDFKQYIGIAPTRYSWT
ncbi:MULTISPECIES: AraC family transcriptional regulator [Sphingobacterium]|uniref:AraC family transcriptional regulator n=1 Tax=Sphingobacterium TaxID=28453 RepID=UPI0013DA163C|nr:MULTISPECIES: helix-turn-helix domain-containing protein [unclassified Sphingobacterium]